MYLHILNAIGQSFRPILIGYLPSTHGLPYSDDILHKMLIRQGLIKISHRDYIITFLKRRMDLQYIEYVLRDLFELEATGFCARVGKLEHGEGPSEVIWFFPMISLFLGDTLQLDMLMGTPVESVGVESVVQTSAGNFIPMLTRSTLGIML